ncbi:transcription factor bHLH91-like [Carica papaya]|uniref:transcription factor bHLH91-like n=1 Tax=Carica papaya TaxID=3649 RepID=UPI000B8CAC0F|nr:transcription factor bHLH91-like [Carica papaya]
MKHEENKKSKKVEYEDHFLTESHQHHRPRHLIRTEMYEDTAGCFSPNSIPQAADDAFSQTLPQPVMAADAFTNNQNTYQDQNLRPPTEALTYHPPQLDASPTSLEIQLQHQLALNAADDQIQDNAHLMHQMIRDVSNQVLSYGSSSWDPGFHEMQDVAFADPNPNRNILHQHPDQQIELQKGPGRQDFNMIPASSLQETHYPPTPDLLNLLHLPRCSASSLLPANSSISFANHNPKPSFGYIGELPSTDSASGSSVLYDPLFHLNLPPQPPLFRELFQSLPSGYSLPGRSLFGGADDQRDMYHEGDGASFDNGILEFTRDMACLGKGREVGKSTAKHFPTEKERRQNLNDKYKALRSLVPNPTKTDRASVVGDAIDYIKELLRTVSELKLLVEKKRCGRERNKRQKTEDDGVGDMESPNAKPLGEPHSGQSYSSSLRSSWLQRKSKVTEVDVRIIDDEVTIKLVQKKKINCLLFVSKVLDEFQLDLHHVAGGHIGEHYSFLFNTKIYEGSSVYASAIANKLIEVVDRQYAAAPPPSSY